MVDERPFLEAVNEVLRARGATAFVCECAADGCLALVELPLTAYDGIRAVGGHVLADRHHNGAATPGTVAAEPRMHELEALREVLRGRVVDVWERLNDTVSELHELHEVPRGEIVDRVDDALDDRG
jgi:hypothetical protein